MKEISKKLLAILLAAVVFCTCIPVSDAEASSYYAGETLIVTVAVGVNLHSLPSVSAEKLTVLGQGSHVAVHEVRTDGWLYVTANGYTGWVDGAYDYFADANSYYNANPQVFNYTNSMQALVMANALNVHSTPVQASTNIVDDLYKGQVVDAIGYTYTGWIKVQYYRNGSQITGYVANSWVQVSKKTVTAATSEKFKKIYGYSAVVKTNYNGINVHYSPSTAATVFTDLYSGDAVNILSESTNWYKISVNIDGTMKTGYVMKKYFSKKDAMSNLRLSSKSKTLKKGKKAQLLVRGNTTGMTLKTSWKSSNKKVATVNSRGYVTAKKKKGTAKITCTVKIGSRSKKLTCKIKVK